MSYQSGRDLVLQDLMSHRFLRLDSYEFAFQEAVKWRKRIREGKQSIADCSRDIILSHVDELIAAATAFRGMALSGGTGIYRAGKKRDVRAGDK